MITRSTFLVRTPTKGTPLFKSLTLAVATFTALLLPTTPATAATATPASVQVCEGSVCAKVPADTSINGGVMTDVKNPIISASTIGTSVVKPNGDTTYRLLGMFDYRVTLKQALRVAAPAKKFCDRYSKKTATTKDDGSFLTSVKATKVTCSMTMSGTKNTYNGLDTIYVFKLYDDVYVAEFFDWAADAFVNPAQANDFFKTIGLYSVPAGSNRTTGKDKLPHPALMN